MSERRCILSGDRADPAGLIRLAISPDGDVLPDVRARAPGRGAWIGVGRAELEQAMAKGKFRGALARAFKGEPITVADDLPERIESALQADLLARLGLEAKASNILTGFEKIDVAARRGQVRLLLHARDAGTDGVRKLDQAWRVGEEREGETFGGQSLPVDRETLSMALGRNNVVHIAVTNAAAAGRISGLLGRWQSYLGCANAAPDSGSADRAPLGDDP
ncbi:DUF448 domain-containing protein [Sphingobium nicotianae]|uniref:DUF448 domain-containing protein n=1 Tax=Sphingobium nicotianae TaxID=2782607 RepID=A0A9X1ISG0_9SPHN|nr:DUF448 domain-containing protein [Sphingobium nicotianae]MBT2188130.1 DUF448 domain-containing protein [Sphingobium nicotianae]